MKNEFNIKDFVLAVTKQQMIMVHDMTVLGEGNPSEEQLIKIGKNFNLKKSKCISILNQMQ
jgi:hypothetical protein